MIRLSRRATLAGIGAVAFPFACARRAERADRSVESPAGAASPIASTRPNGDFAAEREISSIERALGGRIGVAARDTGSGALLVHRADERYAMCSTFKLALVAATLSRIDAGTERSDRRIPYDASRLLSYSPVTKQHVADGSMSIDALCAAAITASDNTAANLLLGALGGPPRLTEFFRKLGDGVSRLDRDEPSLNTAIAGDPRDTTSPRAMLGTFEHIVVGNVLAAPSRQRLLDWLVANTTGMARLRAGLPAGFRTGDKTGTGNNGATGDLAITWPPNRAPLLMVVYAEDSGADLATRNAAFAKVAAVVARHFAS